MGRNFGIKMEEFYIQWHINDRCNLRCIHCYQDDFSGERELSKEGLILISENILNTMEKWKARVSISLTGGEPLLKPELWDLLSYLENRERISEINLITNGTLLNLYLEKILNSSLNKIFVSLDGTTPETNDYIRGKGNFRKVLENIKVLKEKSPFKIFIMFTLMNSNYEEAKELFFFSKSLGIEGFILERFFPLGQGRDIPQELVSKERLLNLYREIFKQCKEDFSLRDVLSTRALQVNFVGDKANLYLAECVVARYGLAILPHGGVFPCRRFTFEIGNLLYDSLDVLWEKSSLLNSLRQKENLKGRCGKCKIKNCFGCRAMVYTKTGDYLEEDADCFG